MLGLRSICQALVFVAASGRRPAVPVWPAGATFTGGMLVELPDDQVNAGTVVG